MRIYRDVIQKAWQVLWHHPWLWAMGILVAVTGNGTEYNSLIDSIEKTSNNASFLATLKDSLTSQVFVAQWHNTLATLNQAPALFTWAFFLTVIVVLIFVWVLMVARAGLIHALGNLEQGKPTNLTQALRAGKDRFWPIFVLNLLARFFTYLILIFAFLPFVISFLAQPEGTENLTMLIVVSFLIFIPLSLIISFVLKYAAIYVVIEREPWWRALERGVNLFFRNWLVSLEMAGLLFLINLGLYLVILFLILPDTLALQWQSLLSLAGSGASLVWTARLLLAGLLLIATGTWYATFEYAAWINLFQRLKTGGVVAKLIRLSGDVPGYLTKWSETAKPQVLPPKGKR